ncbi:MAG: hypothetical protein VX112_04405 [Pseudomonadota bacterium]|nr:hypothetical protein [Pseudomonadota bacterium]
MENSKKFESLTQTISKTAFFLLALVVFPIMQIFKKVLLPVFNLIKALVLSLAWLMRISLEGISRNLIRPLWRYVFKTPCVFLYNYLLKPVAIFTFKVLNLVVVQPVNFLIRGIAWLALSGVDGLSYQKNAIVRSGRYKNTIKPRVVTPTLKAYFLFSHYTMNLAARYTFFALGYMILSFIEAGRQLSNLLVGGYNAADRGLIGVYNFMRVDLQTHEWRKPLIQQQLLSRKQTAKNTKQPISDGDQNKPLVIQNGRDDTSSQGSKTKPDQVSSGIF